METLNPSGYTAVLKNKNFVALWMAQVFSNTSLNGSFFLQLILIEEITGSSGQLGAVIVAFSLPAVLLSAIAGLVVDRMSKKTILFWSNLLRVVTGALMALTAAFLPQFKAGEGYLLVAIYILVFLSSAIGQFFAPAEGSMIPLLVKSENLLPANSLFTLTITASQILGMIILAPLGVKLIGIAPSLGVGAALYLIGAILVSLLPRDKVTRNGDLVGTAFSAWNEISEGWKFVIGRRAIFIALLQLALTSMLTMIMADLAPGFAKRVLGLRAEDASYVFWPAGLGMFLAGIFIGRYGHRFAREMLASVGMIGVAIGLAGLAWAGAGGKVFGEPLSSFRPEWAFTVTALVMFFSLVIGSMMATIMIPAQTIVQERSNDQVRGRVLAVQFTLSNAVGIPPMLFIATLADITSIPRVVFGIAVFVALLAVVNLSWAITTVRAARLRHAHHIPHPPDSPPTP